MIELFSIENQSLNEWIRIGFILVTSVISFFLIRKVLIKIIQRTVYFTKTRWDEILYEKGVFHVLAYLAPLIILHHSTNYYPEYIVLLRKILNILFFFVFCSFISRFLESLHAIYSTYSIARKRPIKGYIQIIKLLIYLVAVILLISALLGKSPFGILGGIGALTAVLLFVFRDTILSFIASIQIMTNDMVRVGDWIEMPKYSADGDVIEMALHTVKVQNFDRTITTIPTYKLIEDSFRNWRGMVETGGRRIMRNIVIDQSSIRFCDEDMIQRYGKIQILRPYIENKKRELEEYNTKHNIDPSCIVNGRRMTNIGTFRAYVEAYLENHPKIHKQLLHMVRQMAPSPEGVALQIYAFTNDTQWVNYENIQADIFDHLLAVLPEFDLRGYQYPGGNDIKNFLNLSRKQDLT